MERRSCSKKRQKLLTKSVRNPVDIYLTCILSDCFYRTILICSKNHTVGHSQAFPCCCAQESPWGHPQLIHRCRMQSRLLLCSAMALQILCLCAAQIRSLVICRRACIRKNFFRRREERTRKTSTEQCENFPVKAHL